MCCQKRNTAVNTPTATGFSCASRSGKMLFPQLLTLFILLPANLADNSSCVSFPHKFFLVLDHFACVAFDCKLPFYLYKHLELSKREENAQKACKNEAVITSAKYALQPI